MASASQKSAPSRGKPKATTRAFSAPTSSSALPIVSSEFVSFEVNGKTFQISEHVLSDGIDTLCLAMEERVGILGYASSVAALLSVLERDGLLTVNS